MQGSVQVDALAFLEKFFLYGAMVYLLGNAMGSRLVAALFVATVLFPTSSARYACPGGQPRSPTGLMALIIAAMLALLPAEREVGGATEPKPRRSLQHERRLATGRADGRRAAAAGSTFVVNNGGFQGCRR